MLVILRKNKRVRPVFSCENHKDQTPMSFFHTVRYTRGGGRGEGGEGEKRLFPSFQSPTPFDARHAHYATRAIHALASR